MTASKSATNALHEKLPSDWPTTKTISTPRKPRKMPKIRLIVSRSFLKISKIIKTLMIGVKAFMMLAKIDETRS